MNDLSVIKRMNDEAATKFGKAAGIEERLAAKKEKLKRVQESHRRAKQAGKTQ